MCRYSNVCLFVRRASFLALPSVFLAFLLPICIPSQVGRFETRHCFKIIQDWRLEKCKQIQRATAAAAGMQLAISYFRVQNSDFVACSPSICDPTLVVAAFSSASFPKWKEKQDEIGWTKIHQHQCRPQLLVWVRVREWERSYVVVVARRITELYICHYNPRCKRMY
jgi:hypothetical protein